jgi:hypothetical protein
MTMDYEVRIDDKFLKGDHKDGEVLTSSELNELENVVKTAINANYEDIQKLNNGELPVGDASTLAGASLSTYNDEALQNSDTKVPTSMQVKQYVDGAVSDIDLEGYYTKREVDDIVAIYDSNGNGIVDNAEKVNNHTVNKDVPSDAKFTDTVVTKTSELTNDSGFLTSETDPVFNASPAKTITSNDISKWNNKQDKLVSGSNIKTVNGANILGSGNVNIPVDITAGDNVTIDENNVISVDLSGTQDKIDSSHKLNSDLVDDSESAHKFVSVVDKSNWNGKYAKPGTGIPKTDLSSDVQTSLGKADSALQEHQDISGKQDIIQYSTIPTAASSLVGKIIQYVGATNGSYTNGYFYKCVENSGSYTWENIEVQTNSGGGTGGASILLRTISDTAPTTGLAEDDKYYSITNNKIYTYDGSEWNEGETPEVGQYYITTDLYQSYIYDTIKTALVPTNEFVYIWDGTQVGSGDARLPIFNYYIKLLKRNIPATIKVVLSNYSGTTHPFDFRVTVDLVPITNPRAADIYLSGFTGLFTINSYLYKYSTYVQNDRNVVNVVQSGNLYCYDFVTMYSSSYANSGSSVLATNNTKAFTPNSDYNPSTVKFVKDTVDEKTTLLNYDGGTHNKIYLSSDNTFGTTAPSSDVESGYHGSNYTINYTYTSAQSITPATKYLLHLVKMLKSSSINTQDITADISIIRNDSAILTKTISIGTIPSTSGTANTTTVALEGEFSFGLDEPLAIQNGDIFRIVLKSSYNYSSAFAGVIYSSSTNPTYIEQYSGGVDSNYVYDTIGGVTKTQHEINAQIGDINTILNSLVSVGGGN